MFCALSQKPNVLTYFDLSKWVEKKNTHNEIDKLNVYAKQYKKELLICITELCLVQRIRCIYIVVSNLTLTY